MVRGWILNYQNLCTVFCDSKKILSKLDQKPNNSNHDFRASNICLINARKKYDV